MDDGEASRRIQHVRSDLKCQVSAPVEVRERDAHCRCVTAEARGRERIQLTWRLLFPTPIAENGCRARVSRRRSRECWRPAVSLVRGGPWRRDSPGRTVLLRRGAETGRREAMLSLSPEFSLFFPCRVLGNLLPLCSSSLNLSSAGSNVLFTLTQ